jgi:hypothetical protein
LRRQAGDRCLGEDGKMVEVGRGHDLETQIRHVLQIFLQE